MGILIGVFIVVIFMDWKYYRIPNVCVAVGVVSGLTMTWNAHSVSGLAQAATSAAAVFLVFYPVYLIGAFGAGDVKLFMMTACYTPSMGTDGFARYMLVTMAIAALGALAKMIAYRESRERVFYLARYLRKAAVTGAVDAYHIDTSQRRCVVRLSFPAFLSLLLMCAGVYA